MNSPVQNNDPKTYVIPREPDKSKTLTLIIYALQAVALFTALPLLVAVIINYVKLDEVKGTWLESHFRWQIKTFWVALGWTLVGMITTIFGIGNFILFVLLCWVIYRIAKGGLRLIDGRTVE